MKVIASSTAEGEIVIMRSDPSGSKECICCAGPHIFSRYVKLDLPPERWGVECKSADDFVNDFACQKGENKELLYEGKRVRVTVEIIDDTVSDDQGAEDLIERITAEGMTMANAYGLGSPESRAVVSNIRAVVK